jgi:integrase
VKGTTYKRCGCRDPQTGKLLNQNCPDLPKRRHGTWMFDTRIDTTATAGRRLKRGGYATETAASDALDEVRALVKLGQDDAGMRRRIGDLIFERSKRGGQLPDTAEVRRRLGAGLDLASPAMTLAEWMTEWLAGKRGIKQSVRRLYKLYTDTWIVPVLGDIPLNRLRAEHVTGLLDLIEERNAEIIEARAEKRRPHLPGDVRQRPRVVGAAGQHRIFAMLRNALNAAIARRGLIDFNPCTGVELPPEDRDFARVWSGEQVGVFLDASSGDRLAVLFRLVLLRGLRRGEACGLRWEDIDLAERTMTVRQTVLQLGGRVVFDSPKTRAGGGSFRWMATLPSCWRRSRRRSAESGSRPARPMRIMAWSSAGRMVGRCSPTG